MARALKTLLLFLAGYCAINGQTTLPDIGVNEGTAVLTRFSNTIGLQPLRAIAGESKFVQSVADLASVASVVSTQTTPSLQFGFSLRVVEKAGSRTLQVVVPPATPVGQYKVESILRGTDGRFFAATLPVRVEAVTIPKSNSGRVPVILINGWQFDCSDMDSTLTASEKTFGDLDSKLETQGIPVAFFNNCAYGGAVQIEDLGAQLGAFISNLTYTDGTSVPQVDLIAHSMGGLIARAYLAGLQADGTLTPPLDPKVRKLVEIATPNFGSFQATNVGVQVPEMIPGSSLLWNLATWNQNSDDLRGVDALAIIGNAGTLNGVLSGASDGVVSLTSASLGFARQHRTQILPYCHIDTTPANPVGNSAYASGLVACLGSGIAEAPETGQLILSFLAAASVWNVPATTPNPSSTPEQDPYLSKYGGMYFAMVNAAGQYLGDFSQVLFGSVQLQNGAPSGSTVFYDDFVGGSGNFQATSITSGTLTCGSFSEPVGYYVAIRCKLLPAISSVTPQESGTSGTVVQSGATISINGAGFGFQCPTCGVWAANGTANGTPLPVSSWVDTGTGAAITASLPASYNGLVTLVVKSAAGQDSINIMASPLTASCTYGLNLGGQGFSSQGGSGTISISTAANCPWSVSNLPSWISLTGSTSGGGAGTISFSAAPNSAGDLSGTFDVGGQPFTVEETAATVPGLASAGSLAQVASQGGWSFTLDAINLGSSAATARFNFADNNGSPLGLPLTFPQSSTMSGPLLAATLDRTLQPSAQVLMSATGPANSTPVVGWGQLLTNGGISGFGIFSNSTYGWNAVVPLETRNAGSYVLAFDNTGSLSTGVAIANVAAVPANVNVIIRDDTGATIGTPHVLGLSPLGHASFMLTQYPETAGIRGTVEFDTPSGGQISVLGLRANGPALTTLPVLAGGSAGGGSIAHVTYDGGYTSTFYLVNTGTTPSPFTLSFFDGNGNPLATPLVQPQSETVPEISGTLNAGAMMVVEAQGQDPLSSSISGSAQLVSSGNVSGFEIFRSTTFGQEASVPLETRTPNSFVLVFDNTNGLTTGVALANSASTQATVTLKLLDDKGYPLGTGTTIKLDPRGHTSFSLPNTYNATQNMRGMAEFVVPAGGAITVIGLRAKSDGTLTTIPVLTR